MMARAPRRISWTLFVWLVLVWIMLWGGGSLSTVVFGVLLAVGVLLLYPMPQVHARTFARPLRLLGLAGYVVLDLLKSAVRVGADVLRSGVKVRAVVIAVPVLSNVDHEIAFAANVVSLTPGKFMLQIDRDRGIFYVYALGVRSVAAAVRTHNDVIDTQVRVTKVFGAGEELRDVHARAEQARRSQPMEESS